jgi:hypothetical protein
MSPEFVPHNLIAALLAGYEDIQNIRHLVICGRLAVEAAETDSREKWAINEVLRITEAKLDAMISTIVDANNTDYEVLVSRRVPK